MNKVLSFLSLIFVIALSTVDTDAEAWQCPRVPMKSLQQDSSVIALNPTPIIFDSTSHLIFTDQDSIILNNPFLESNFDFSGFIITDSSEQKFSIRFPPDPLQLIENYSISIWALIDKQGNVIRILLEFSSSESLLKSLVNAVKSKKFAVGTKNGVPMLRWVNIPMQFRIKY